jgi:NitT/TauT family transport system ATP-binding protein
MRVRISNVSKVFHTRSGDVDALKDVSLEVHEGEFVAIVLQ